MELKLQSIITCPKCNFQQTLKMALDSFLFFTNVPNVNL